VKKEKKELELILVEPVFGDRHRAHVSHSPSCFILTKKTCKVIITRPSPQMRKLTQRKPFGRISKEILRCTLPGRSEARALFTVTECQLCPLWNIGDSLTGYVHLMGFHQCKANPGLCVHACHLSYYCAIVCAQGFAHNKFSAASHEIELSITCKEERWRPPFSVCSEENGGGLQGKKQLRGLTLGASLNLSGSSLPSAKWQ
jgi:hypothetical protein